ncbi:hypothetical protein RFI_03244, partial [Reticulomyxa filosa]
TIKIIKKLGCINKKENAVMSSPSFDYNYVIHNHPVTTFSKLLVFKKKKRKEMLTVRWSKLVDEQHKLMKDNANKQNASGMNTSNSMGFNSMWTNTHGQMTKLPNGKYTNTNQVQDYSCCDICKAKKKGDEVNFFVYFVYTCTNIFIQSHISLPQKKKVDSRKLEGI